jgi:hypothetical protein
MNFPRKVFGVMLIIFSILGLLVSIFAVVQVWQLRIPVATRIYDGLVFSEKVVNTSISGLTVVDSSLTNIRTSLTSLEDSTLLMAQSMEDTSNLIGSFSNLFKTDIKDTLENTKLSLVAAQSSALIIDNLLYGLSRIPLLNIVYEPPKPLNEALKEIGDTLTDMPESMDDISGNLTDSNKNLLSLKDGIDEISMSFADFQRDLSNAQGVIDDYLTDLTTIQDSLLNAQAKIFNWSVWVAILLTVLIVLIGITQVAAVMQGWDMMHYEQKLDRLIEDKIIEWEARRLADSS